MDRTVQVKKLYTIIALVNLLLSLFGIIIFQNLPLEQRIVEMVVCNFGYHLMYWSIGFIPRYQLRHVEAQPTIFRYTKKGAKVGAYFTIFAGSLMLINLVYWAIVNSEYRQLFFICAPMGIVLGGWSLKLFLTALGHHPMQK